MPPEKHCHGLWRDETLKQGRKGDPDEEGRARGFYVAQKVFQKAQKDVWIRIAVFGLEARFHKAGFFEAFKIKNLPAFKKEANQEPRRNAAEKTAHKTDRQGGLAKGGAVKKELGVQEYGTHHKSREPVLLHAFLGERR